MSASIHHNHLLLLLLLYAIYKNLYSPFNMVETTTKKNKQKTFTANYYTLWQWYNLSRTAICFELLLLLLLLLLWRQRRKWRLFWDFFSINVQIQDFSGSEVIKSWILGLFRTFEDPWELGTATGCSPTSIFIHRSVQVRPDSWYVFQRETFEDCWYKILTGWMWWRFSQVSK